jgi:transposase-like protein
MEKVTMNSLAKRITDEASAYAYLESLRWPNGPVCPHCGNRKAYFLKPAGGGKSRATRTGAPSQRRVWKCAKCRKQFSVTTGTIFHGSKVPLQTWLFVFFEMVSNKNGLAAREVERRYDVSPKTAWYMCHRIRTAMASRAPHLMTGVVVADETFIGGDPHNLHADERKARKANQRDKTPVVSLIDADTGEVRSRVVANVQGRTIKAVIAENVDRHNAILHTDSAIQYTAIGRGFVQHHTVNHRLGQYVDLVTGASTNKAENYFSQLKRSIDGTHHNVSREHLDRYLGEFDFRYSTCHLTDTERMARLMGQTGGRRVSYKRVKDR